MAQPRKDIPTGTRFGRLVVTKQARIFEDYGVKGASVCECDCGRSVRIANKSLLGGRTRSCGCLWREMMAARKQTAGNSTLPRPV